MKIKEWVQAKRGLIKEYKKRGITTCEGKDLNEKCMYDYALSFHHIKRRSSGEAENTLEGTRLLCPSCHSKADNEPGFKDFNEALKRLR